MREESKKIMFFFNFQINKTLHTKFNQKKKSGIWGHSEVVTLKAGPCSSSRSSSPSSGCPPWYFQSVGFAVH